jgi:hypothetical protein
MYVGIEPQVLRGFNTSFTIPPCAYLGGVDGAVETIAGSAGIEPD